ncbi:MAG: hypothetical protein OSP8Acid_10450 [uncultured Acidilobus sp. OSP8]|nr:MAG: hypothetical protein OSP8Acid_10450 [uncultured Acidilobus sp. OSP8]
MAAAAAGLLFGELIGMAFHLRVLA